MSRSTWSLWFADRLVLIGLKPLYTARLRNGGLRVPSFCRSSKLRRPGDIR
jgi:predicted nicotinamide N-methyase